MNRSPASWTRSRRNTTLDSKPSSMPFGNSCRHQPPAAAPTVPRAVRVALALSLGALDLEAFRFAHEPPLEQAEAARVLERRGQQSRRPSRCLAELIG